MWHKGSCLVLPDSLQLTMLDIYFFFPSECYSPWWSLNSFADTFLLQNFFSSPNSYGPHVHCFLHLLLSFKLLSLPYLVPSSIHDPASEVSSSLLVSLHPLTNPMGYGTWRFDATFSRSLHLYLSWAESTQFFELTPIYLRSILILSSHLCVDLPRGHFPVVFPVNILKAFLTPSILDN